MHRPDRPRLAAALAVCVPLGLASKFAYGGPGAEWASSHGAGVLYEVFWVGALCWAAPNVRAWQAGVAVFVATCAIEALQLWRPPWLVAVRSTLPGAILLGDSFDWCGFPHYALGSAIGWAMVLWARRPTRCSAVDSTNGRE